MNCEQNESKHVHIINIIFLSSKFQYLLKIKVTLRSKGMTNLYAYLTSCIYDTHSIQIETPHVLQVTLKSFSIRTRQASFQAYIQMDSSKTTKTSDDKICNS